MIIFKELRIQNFLSWKDVEVPLANQGLVYLVGENGSGKSSLFSAIKWILYGKTDRRILVDDVVNRKIGKNCTGQLSLGNAKHSFDITRYRSHKEFSDSLHLNLDGENCHSELKDATQDRIINLFGLNQSAFTSAILLEQGIERYFSMFTDAEQKEVLENILSLNIFSNCQKLAKDKNNLISGKLEEFDDRIRESSFELEELSTSISELSKISITKRAQINEDLEEVMFDLSKLKTSIDKKDTEEKKLLKEFTTLSQEKMGIFKTEQRLKSFMRRVESLTNSECVTCGRIVTQEDAKQVCKKLSTQISKLEIEMSQLDKKITFLNSKMEKFKSLSEERVRHDALLEQKSKLQEQLKSIGNESLYQEYLNRQSTLNVKLKKYKKRQSKCIEQSKLYDFWITGFGNKGLKQYLIARALPILNERSNYYLSFLSNIKLKFLIKGTKLELLPIHPKGGSSYNSFSGGEKKRVDIAISLALQDLISAQARESVNLLMLDEIFGGLDKEGVKQVVELLNNLTKDTVIVTSHRQELRDYFPTVWEVTKKRDFSRLEVM